MDSAPRPQHWRVSAEQAAEIALKGGVLARLPGTVGFLGSKSVRILLTGGDSHCYPCIATCATCSLKKEYLESFKGNESYESQLHGCCRNVANNKPGATLATTCCTKRCQRHQTKTMAALFLHFCQVTKYLLPSRNSDLLSCPSCTSSSVATRCDSVVLVIYVSHLF